MPTDLTPRLGIHLTNFSNEDRGDWSALLDLAVGRRRQRHRQGGRVRPRRDGRAPRRVRQAGGRGVRGGTQPTGPDGLWLEPLTLLSVIAGTHDQRPPRHPRAARRAAPPGDARQDAGDARRAVERPRRPRRRRRLAAGGVRRGRARLLDPRPAARRDDRDPPDAVARARAPRYQAGGRTVAGIHQMPKPRQAGGVPVWVSGTLNKKVAERLAKYGSGLDPVGRRRARPDRQHPGAVEDGRGGRR